MDCTGVQIAVAEAEGRKVMRVAGELTLAGTPPLRAALLEALNAGDSVVLDLRDVKEIDLCGLQILCSAHRTFIRQDRTLSLANVPQRVRTLAGRAGYDAQRSICPYRQGGNCHWACGA